MDWRLAESLETLRAQINNEWPNRSKVSDGTIGDARHSARKSDHNPNRNGVVCALDITKDLEKGPDLHKLLPSLLLDARTKYIIFDRKIYNPSIQKGAARAYRGSNAHTQHLHISVKPTKIHYDDPSPWNVAGATILKFPEMPRKPRQLLKRGMTGGDIPVAQDLLKKLGYYNDLVDGIFGKNTDAAVRAMQARTGLKADGIVGPLTWAKLAS